MQSGRHLHKEPITHIAPLTRHNGKTGNSVVICDYRTGRSNAGRDEVNETKLASLHVKSRRGRMLVSGGQGTFSMTTGLEQWNQQQSREAWWQPQPQKRSVKGRCNSSFFSMLLCVCVLATKSRALVRRWMGHGAAGFCREK